MAGFAELAALRLQLEVMLGTDLGHRPALGTRSDRRADAPAPGRVQSSRVTVVAEEVVTVAPAIENPIIDVPEEPRRPTPPDIVAAGPGPESAPVPGQPPADGRRWISAARPGRARVVAAAQPAAAAPPQPEAPWRPEVRIGRHSADGGQRPEPTCHPPRCSRTTGPRNSAGRHWVPPEDQQVQTGRHRGPRDAEGEPVDDGPQGQHADGQSFADLMARFQANLSPSGGGRRRRAD